MRLPPIAGNGQLAGATIGERIIRFTLGETIAQVPLTIFIDADRIFTITVPIPDNRQPTAVPIINGVIRFTAKIAIERQAFG